MPGTEIQKIVRNGTKGNNSFDVTLFECSKQFWIISIQFGQWFHIIILSGTILEVEDDDKYRIRIDGDGDSDVGDVVYPVNGKHLAPVPFPISI